jgi:hypothetical protein
VRTGCLTCKARKVKCDETKPACLRCVKTGRRCDGYAPVSPPSGRSGLALSPQLTPEFESAEERRAFDYYRARSAPLIGSALDIEFWGGLVVKLSVREPVVRHAMLALSSLHEASSLGGVDTVGFQRSFAFAGYGKAISSMRQWDPQRSSEAIPLLVCLLFVCIEFLLGDDPSSQLHICQGREILFRMEQTHSPDFALVKRFLAPVYMRLSLPGFFRAGRPAPMPPHLLGTTVVPAEFESLDQARSLLYYLVDDSLRITVEGKPAVYDPNMTSEHWEGLRSLQDRLHSQLRQWNISFAMLLASLPPTTSRTVSDTQRLLQILYEASTIWVATALQPLEIAYDDHIPAFTSIVSNATALIQSGAYQSPHRVFAFETEIIAPLYWTAIKCRHPLLRRTALRLLMRDEMKNRRENIWATQTVVAVASRVIELEEQDLAKPPGFLHWEGVFGEPGENMSYTSDSYDEPEVYPQISPEMDMGAPPDTFEVYEGELTVPVDHPPTIRRAEVDAMDWPSDEEHGPFPVPKMPYRFRSQEPRPFTPMPMAPAPAMSIDLGSMGTEPPYGVPEMQRIKNTLIGPVQDGGVWVTVFRNAKDGGTTWDVTREFLKQ